MTLQEYINQHGSAIIRLNKKQKIGKVLSFVETTNSLVGREKIKQPFKIIREATAEEYTKQSPNLSISARWPYYYEVRTD